MANVDFSGLNPINFIKGVFSTTPWGQESEAAHTEADQKAQEDALAKKQKAEADALAISNLKASDALAQSQEQDRVTKLASDQATNLGLYKEQQALEEKNQTTAEQNAYTSANDQLQGAQEQLGSNRAGVASQGSSIIAGAAARGIKVGSGAVQSASNAGKGDIVTNKDGTVSYAKGAPSVYDSGSSPLAQLASYEINASKALENEAQNTVDTTNLATGEIVSGTAAFNAQQAENLKTFSTQQSEQMGSALLDQSQTLARMNLAESQASSTYAQQEQFQSDVFTQTESFTQTNLQTYDSSLWLAAFASVFSDATSLLKMINPMTTT
jgi:hypothetical protein